MSEGFGGLPEYTGTPQDVSESKVSEAKAEDVVPEAQSQAPDVVDLDKLERFRFGGKEYSKDDWSKEWESSRLRYSDYTKKTQEVAEARKYAENFSADLVWVAEDPQSRIEQLKKVYPKQYVDAAERLLSRVSSPSAQQPKATSSLPPELKQVMDEVSEWKQSVREQEKRAALTQIEGLHQQYSSKYPYADADVVDTRVMLALEDLKMTKEELSRELPRIYEQAYKQHNDQLLAKAQSREKAKVEEQVKAGKAARDTGPGGTTPGQAPKKYGRLSEVGEDLMRAIGGK
jgi:hypothetical protein